LETAQGTHVGFIRSGKALTIAMAEAVVQKERPKSGDNAKKKGGRATFAIDPLAPMLLVPLENFSQLGRIPRSSDRDQVGVVPLSELIESGRRSRSLLAFISHRWLNPSNDPKTMHPDVETNDKYKVIVEGLSRLLAGLDDVDEVFLWVDFCCIEQDDLEVLGAGIRSLPAYIEQCDVLFTPYNEDLFDGAMDRFTEEFIQGAGDQAFGLFRKYKTLSQYVSRGWCRLEMFLGTNCPMPESGFNYFDAVGVASRSDRPHLLFGDHQAVRTELPEVAPRVLNSIFKHIHPARGGVTVESDRVALNSLVNLFDVEFDATDSYEGHVDNEGKPHGRGKMIYATGAVYEGDWVHGEWEGEGSLLYANGTVYVGGWKNGKRHGFGNHYLSNGLHYQGEFMDGDSHGPGRLFYQSGKLKFEGVKDHTKWSGPLKEFFPSGQIKFDGESKDNKWHGRGIEYAEDGTVLRSGTWDVGTFVEGTASGTESPPSSSKSKCPIL